MAMIAVAGAAAAVIALKSATSSAFVPTVAGGSRGLRGAAGAVDTRGTSAPTYTFSASNLLAAGVATAAVSAAVVRRGRAKAAARAQRTQVRYNREDSGLLTSGPIVTYAKALSDVAVKTNEAVPVTKDVMKVRSLMKDEEFLDKILYIQNNGKPGLQKAQEIIKLMKLESKAVPKFIVFLAKKQRLMQLKRIMNEYSLSLYETQSIAPVVITSAERLSPEQLGKIKEKMKARTGAKEVKLIQQVDPSLIGGFTLKWDFLDPDTLETAAAGMDLSIKKVLKSAALNEGIVSDF